MCIYFSHLYRFTVVKPFRSTTHITPSNMIKKVRRRLKKEKISILFFHKTKSTVRRMEVIEKLKI